MGKQQSAQCEADIAFDSRLDYRQLLPAEQILEAASHAPELVAIRCEPLLDGQHRRNYLDLILYSRASDKLLIALGLPVHGQTLVWPEAYASWPRDLLGSITEQALAKAVVESTVPGQVCLLPGFKDGLRLEPGAVAEGRSCPGLESYWTIAQLLWRYDFVRSFVNSGKVLEVACGVGYGAGLLLKGNASIDSYLGMDLDAGAVDFARRINVDARAQFECADLGELQSEGFDWVLSLETIEHTSDPEQFLENLKRHMKVSGRMILSIPCERWHGFHLNRAHWSAWNLERIRRFVDPHFEKVRYFTYERPRFDEHAFDIGRVKEFDWEEDRSRHEGYFVVLEGARTVARRPRVVVQRRYARGDALQATPIIHELRRRFTDHVLVVSTDVNEVFSNNPDVDLLMATSSGFKPRRDDLLVNLDETYERSPRRHMLDVYADAAGVSLADPQLRLYPNRWDYDAARSLLETAFSAWHDVEYIVAIHMCTTPDRGWPAEHWKKFLGDLKGRRDVGVVVVGAGSDLTVDQQERLVSVVNGGDFLTTAACIALCDVLVGPDSSLLHVAAAVGTPAIGLYGMALPDHRIPYAAMQTAIVAPVECAGCLSALPPPVTNPRCKFGNAFCMDAIAPELVLQRLDDMRSLQRQGAWRRRFSLLTGAPELAGRDSGMPVVASLPQTHPGRAERQWFEHAGAERRLSIAVVVRSPSESADASTAQRLEEAQWLQPSEIVVCNECDLSALNERIRGLTSKWLLLLRDGDDCDPWLLATLSRQIASKPDWQMVYFDETQIADDGASINPHYKPDFNLEYLRSLPYTGTAIAVRKSLFESLGGFESRYEGVEEYDFTLRTYERFGACAIGHISGDLIRRRQGVNHSTRPLQDVLGVARAAVAEHLLRIGVEATVEAGPLPATCRVHYRHSTKPLVSIIIPTRNQRLVLDRCVQSLFRHTAWPNFELVIVDNGSDAKDAVEFLAGLRRLGEELEGRIRILDYPEPFNYSAMNNLAAREARGEYLLLLNDDTAALHDEWLDVMMAQAQRSDVGVVGAKLLYPDGRVQHAGVVLGMKGPAEHPFIGRDAKDGGYFARLQVDQEYSAVTGACLLVRRELFESVGGLDAEALAVSYSDIDLCLKIRKLGKRVIWTPYAVLMHEGSKSQTGNVETTTEVKKAERFAREQAVMYRRWLPQMAADPSYNRYLTLAGTDFQIEDDTALRWDPDWRPAHRIITQPADRMGCGEYRIIAPTRALINAGRIQGFESERIYTPAELARVRPDALVLQRQIEPHQIDAIERHKRFNDVFCVFEIDDLVTNVPVKNAHKSQLPKDIYRRLRRAVSLCDRLVVATDELAEAYRDLNSDIKVVPNYIELERWGRLMPRRRVGEKPRVGWAGGVSHTGDLELIAGVVEALKDEVEWVFFGMCPERIRPYVHEYHPPVPLDQYPEKLASLNLDLAMAPLEEVPFNRAKSHLRLLEYGILGYPVICSDMEPYRGGYPVVTVRNRFRDWVDAIRDALVDLDALSNRGDALREYVNDHWVLENNLDVWLDGWLPAR